MRSKSISKRHVNKVSSKRIVEMGFIDRTTHTILPGPDRLFTHLFR